MWTAHEAHGRLVQPGLCCLTLEFSCEPALETMHAAVASLTSPSEQEEIAVGIAHDEGSCTPRFGPERLSELDARSLVFEKERLCVFQRDRSGQQLLAVASAGINYRVVDLAKVQSGAIAENLAVKWRLTVSEGDGKPEHPRIELARGDDVSDVELRLGCNKCGHGEATGWGMGRAATSPTERLPTLETDHPSNELLSVRQPERLRQDFTVVQAAAARQLRSDSRGNRIVLLPVPAKIQLRLFSEMFDVEHRGRTPRDVVA